MKHDSNAAPTRLSNAALARLIDKACKYDHRSLERLFELFTPVWKRRVNSFGLQAADAEDALAALRETVLYKIHGLQHTQAFTAWSLKCLNNIVLHLLKSHKAILFTDLMVKDEDEEKLLFLIDPNAPDPLAVFLKTEEGCRVQTLLDGLPVAQRGIIVLTELKEFSYEETAAAVGVPVGTVRSRRHHGMAKLTRLAEQSLADAV